MIFFFKFGMQLYAVGFSINSWLVWSYRLYAHTYLINGFMILALTMLELSIFAHLTTYQLVEIYYVPVLPYFQYSHFMTVLIKPLRWRHNGRDSVSYHQPHDCLFNRLLRRRSKKKSKLRVTGLCVGNSPGTGEFPAQMTSNAENVSIWWRHHAFTKGNGGSWKVEQCRLNLTCREIEGSSGQSYMVLTSLAD